jgi:hypothetical protein
MQQKKYFGFRMIDPKDLKDFVMYNPPVRKSLTMTFAYREMLDEPHEDAYL